LTMPGLKWLSAPKGLDVEAESNGLALRIPRYSAETERGNSMSKRRRNSIGSSCETNESSIGYSPGENTASDH
jgi:hypothetical protein